MFNSSSKIEFPAAFSSEISERNTISRCKNIRVFTSTAKTTYINPNNNKNSFWVIKNNKNRNVPRPEEIRKVYFPAALNFIFSIGCVFNVKQPDLSVG